MKKLFPATLALVLLSSVSAFAGGPRAAAGLTLGPNVPLGKYGDTNGVGVSLSGYLVGDMTYHSSWRLEVGYDRATVSDTAQATCDQLGVACGSEAVKRFNAGVQWTFRDSWPNATPYIFGTLGVYNQAYNKNVVGIDFSETATDLGISFGGGVVWMRTALWGYGVDLHVHGVFREAELANAWYMSPSAFLHFRF